MNDNQPILRLEELEDSVLYDLFYEAGTILGGYLLDQEMKAQSDGNPELAKQLDEERRLLRRERSNIAYDDRTGQIACKLAWDARIRELAGR